MKVIAIIQARMSSTRLPGKVLKDISGKAQLHHVWGRALASDAFDEALIATSTESDDDAIEIYCHINNIPIYRGDLNNVLSRYYQAALSRKADVIARFTADCPLLDPFIVKKAVDMYLDGDYDYVSNVYKRTFPRGLDVEVFGFDTLKKVYNGATEPSEYEHVTPYILKNPHVFRLGHFSQDINLADYRWTVDKPKDLEFVREVYKELGSEIFDMESILKLLDKRPELLIREKPEVFF